MRKTIAYGAATIQGDWPVQEDGYFVDPAAGMFALADGIGGRGAGDLAARTVLQEARGKSRELPPQADQLRQLFEDWNAKLLAWNAPRAPARRGACSLLLGSIAPNGRAFLAGVGSNAAFLLRSGSLHVLLSPQSAPRAYPGAPLLPDQALGLQLKVHPELRSFSLVSGDVLLALTGGMAWEGEAFLLDLLGQMALRAQGEGLKDMASRLVEAHGGLAGQSWNRSLLLFEFP